jgi:hypothetical protein
MLTFKIVCVVILVIFAEITVAVAIAMFLDTEGIAPWSKNGLPPDYKLISVANMWNWRDETGFRPMGSHMTKQRARKSAWEWYEYRHNPSPKPTEKVVESG